MRSCFVRLLIVVLFLLADITSAQVHVRGYYRKDGTYVSPHYRSNPDGNYWNNWSTSGNVNPYTGEVGTKLTPPRSQSAWSWSPTPYAPPDLDPPTVHVDGYLRRDGTYVQPHHRSWPDGDPSNNWSTYPNVNPYTGKIGTKRMPETDSYNPLKGMQVQPFGLRPAERSYAPLEQQQASTWNSHAFIDGYERGLRMRQEANRAELEQASIMLEVASALSAARHSEVAAPPTPHAAPVTRAPVSATRPVPPPAPRPKTLPGVTKIGLQRGDGRPEVIEVHIKDLGAGKLLFAWKDGAGWSSIVRDDSTSATQAVKDFRGGAR